MTTHNITLNMFPDDLLRNHSQIVINNINRIYDIENDITDNYYNQLNEEDEKIDKQYFIGSSVHFYGVGHLLASCIKPSTFFSHVYDLVVLYLKVSSVFYIEFPSVDIIQLNIIGEYYIAIKKTHWLRLIQKHWKKVFQKRKNIIHKRMLLKNLYYRSVNGLFPKGLNYLPGIKSLLCCYRKTAICQR